MYNYMCIIIFGINVNSKEIRERKILQTIIYDSDKTFSRDLRISFYYKKDISKLK